ncbi:MAG: hypothetical protein ACON4Z_01180 [Planctomycetota bacterium]
MNQKTTLTAALTLLGALMQSCQMGPNVPPEVHSRQFQDYVVPSGFRLKDQEHQSYAREVASWRHGHYVYSGQEDVTLAASYVEANMGRHNWQLRETEDLDGNGKRLQFERGIYTADYEFSRNGNITKMTVDYKTDYSRL